MANAGFTDLVPNTNKCTGTGTWQDGFVLDNADDSAKYVITLNYYTELVFAVQFDGTASGTYFFFARQADLALDAASGGGAEVAVGGAPRNINIDNEPIITVTDVPTVLLPDALVINIEEPAITVTDVVADMAQELVITVFDGTGVTDVLVDIEKVSAPIDVSGVFDETSVTEDVTVVLPDALEINIAETIIAVTDVPTVKPPWLTTLEVDVFDGTTVTDVETVDEPYIPISTLEIDVYETVTVTEYVETPGLLFRMGIAFATCPTSTGDMDIDLPGFGRPKAAIFLVTNCAADATVRDGEVIGYGLTDGTNSASFVTMAMHGYGSEAGRKRVGAAGRCVEVFGDASLGEAPFTLASASFKNWRDNGVTITWEETDLSYASILAVIFIAGDKVTGADVDWLDFPNSDGGEADVTTGFRPDLIMFFGQDVSRGTTHNQSQNTIGFCLGDGALTQRCLSQGHDLSNAAGESTARLFTNRVCAYMFYNAITCSGQVIRMNTDGFRVKTLDWTSIPDMNPIYMALKIEDYSFFLDDYTAPTSTGDDVREDVGFRPEFLFSALSMLPAVDTTYQSADAGSFGYHIVDTYEVERGACGSDEYGSATMDIQTITDDALVTKDDDGAAGFDGTFSSFDKHGWTINFSVVDGSTRKWLSLLIGRGIGNVYDTVTVTDVPTVYVQEIGPPEISEFETVTVTESVAVLLPDALEISVFEAAITVADVPTVAAPFAVPKEISEFDTTTVTDAVTVVLPDALKVSVFDGATISDFIGPCTVTCPTWDDDFTGSNGDPPDKQKWYQHQVLNPSDIQNNKLNMTVTGSGDDRYSGVRSTFRLTGNFSVTMDFDLVTYPSTQRWEVVIQLWNPSNDYRYSMGRHYRTGYNNHAYAAFKYEGSWVWDTDPTTDTSGKVRIIRQGTNMYCAYWQPDTGWTALASWSGVDTGDLEVRLWLATHDPSYPAAEANIDNFIIGRGCAGVERWILLPDVYDEVTVVDAETVVVKGATLQISEFETTTVTEDVTVSLPDALEISVFDVTTVTDVETVEVEEAGLVIISVFDTVTVTESVELAQELVLSVFDTVVVTESVDLAQELVPSVFDTVTVADVVDNVLVTEGLLEVSVFDTITVTESVDLAKELTVLVFETTGVTEYVELAKELTISVFSGTTVTDVETVTVVSLEISPNVFDGVTVGEAVTVSLPDALLVDVFDGVTAVDVETVEVGIVEFYNVSVYDETTVTDSVAAALPDALAITVSDTITVGEFTDFQFLNYFVSVFDTVTVTELVEVAPQLKIDVFDTTAVTDSISVALDDLEANVFDTVSVVDVVGFFIPNFGINVFETVTVTESTAGIIGTVILSTFDVVTVTDYSDLYWIVSKGVARIEVAERAPDIEFAARVPRIDYLVRS
jgi:hypothetical protein